MTTTERRTTLILRFLSGPLAEQTAPVEKAAITIGRDLANDIVVASDLKVSRQHARIAWRDGDWWIENISHGNVMSVNGADVHQSPLPSDAVVVLGESTSFVASQPDVAISPRAVGRATDQRTSAPLTAAEAETTGELPNRIEPTQVATLTQMRTPTLVVTSNTNNNKQTYPLIGSITSIGRDAANSIVIDDRIVSARHVQIVREGETFTLIHPHPDRPRTLNGLLYQGHAIQGDERFSKQLARGDIFRIGDENGTLITLTFHDGAEGADRAEVAAAPLEPIQLGADELTIGRRPDNTIVLAHPQVSGHHAQLARDGSAYDIVDLNSTNHVYVNGQMITRHRLQTGDEIRIGPYRLIYDGDRLRQYDESAFIRIDAKDLTKHGVHGVTLLDDISLSIPPRSFVALVGGSGAGKSTLLDALNGLRPAQNGQVLYNGRDYYRNMAAYSTQIGYVPQDDIVHRDLTVERALYYAAKIRLPSDYTDEQIEHRIKEVLDEVELTHRRTLMVRDLSGGQRKRVSIALELLANPSVFFLDEPTSGLDPGLDRKMMFLLRKLADRGHTIVLVTHATNNINSCDFVCFLAAGGRLVYFGPPEEAKTYFGKTDFAEIYTSLEATDNAPEAPAQAQSRFRTSPEYTRYISGESRPVSAAAAPGAGTTKTPRAFVVGLRPAWAQFMLLSRRYIELLRNDSANLMILLLQAPIIALMLVLMLRFEVGAGIFDPNAVAQCRTQIVTASGPLILPAAKTSLLTNCHNVVIFLTTTPAGQANARASGGVNQALQAFIAPGPGADAQKALFIMAFATILFGCINGAREFVKEAPIYRRERAVNLGIAPYMFSKIAVLGLLCLLQSAIVVLVVQVGEPLHGGILLPPLLETYVTLALTSFAGLMIGLTVSAVAPNTDRAMSFVPLVLLPQVIFSGAIIALKDWMTQILAVVFPSRWAMAALGSTVGLHAEAIGNDHLFGSDNTYHGRLYSIYTQTDAIHRLGLSWGALAAISIVLMGIIGYFLKRKDRRT